MSRAFKISLVLIAIIALGYFRPWPHPRPRAAIIVREMYPPQPGVVASYLLAFEEQDNYSTRLESALLLLDIGGGKWRLLITHRDAHYPKFDPRKWVLQLPLADGPPIPGSRDFLNRPSAADVDAFIRDAEWFFQPIEGYHFTRAAIYSDTWQKILGYAPSYEIAKPKT